MDYPGPEFETESFHENRPETPRTDSCQVAPGHGWGDPKITGGFESIRATMEDKLRISQVQSAGWLVVRHWTRGAFAAMQTPRV